ncbi:hypothetical protein MRX96_048113 [Rhipicephalus microplus]
MLYRIVALKEDIFLDILEFNNFLRMQHRAELVGDVGDHTGTAVGEAQGVTAGHAASTVAGLLVTVATLDVVGDVAEGVRLGRIHGRGQERLATLEKHAADQVGAAYEKGEYGVLKDAKDAAGPQARVVVVVRPKWR